MNEGLRVTTKVTTPLGAGVVVGIIWRGIYKTLVVQLAKVDPTTMSPMFVAFEAHILRRAV